MTAQEIYWDSNNEQFFFVDNIKELYTAIRKSEQPEVYKHYMNVYCSNWWVKEDYITNNYKFLERIEDMYE